MVSILIGTYNNLDYFKIALKSVFKQTYLDYEIIISDDSTNNLISDYIKTIINPKLKYYKNSKSLGISMNMFQLISYSNGDYFSFLNHDDYWDDTFLEKMMLNIEQNQTDLCFSDHWLIDANNNILVEESETNSILYKRNSLNQITYSYPGTKLFYINYTIPVAMAAVFKKRLFFQFDFPKKVGPAYDKWILLNFILLKCRISYVPERLTFYRVHQSSTTVTSSRLVYRSVIYVLLRSLLKFEFSIKEKKLLLLQLLSYLRSYIKNI